MCGIAGFVTRRPGTAPDSLLARMTDAIRHRGPDGSGYYRDPYASLGHRRLSIIDVSAGHQPMSSEDGSLWITYNGEIFNHADLRPALEQAGHQYRNHPARLRAVRPGLRDSFPRHVLFCHLGQEYAYVVLRT